MVLQEIKDFFTIKNLLYFFSFIAGWPCVFYLMGWLPNYQFNYVILLLFCIIYLIIKQSYNLNIVITNLIIIQILTWFFYYIIHSDTSYITRIFYLTLTFCLLKIQTLDKSYNLFKIFDSWITLQVILGAIGMILVLVGVLKPLFTFTEMDGRPGYFFGIFTTNTYLGGLVRNAGFFDEPGALANWGIYALLINKIFVKNKIIEYPLIIGLLSTLSTAYYIQIILYLLFYYRKNSKSLIISLLIIYIAMLIFASYNHEINDAIFGRFEYSTETGSFKGDNRSELFNRTWGIFKKYPIIGLGAEQLGIDSWKIFGGFVGGNFFYNLAADGIIGFIITYLPLIFLFKKSTQDKNILFLSIILLVGFLQRPYDSTQLLYPLLIYSILYYTLNYKTISFINNYS